MKKIAIVSVIIINIIMLICILPFPVKINTTLSGVQWKGGDQNYSEPVDIMIQGTYNKYLFKNNVLKGHITISDTQYTSEENLYDLIIYKNKSDLIPNGLLGYYGIDKGSICIGGIWVKGSFKKIVIQKETDGVPDYYISAPASDRESALHTSAEFNIVKNFELS